MQEFIEHFFRVYSQMYVLHWQTKYYSRHLIFDEFNEELEDFADKMVESYQGKYGKIQLDECDIEIKNLKELNLSEMLNNFKQYLLNDFDVEYQNDKDLLAIRDEIVSLINKNIFLLTLE